jgi:hypothetical protein
VWTSAENQEEEEEEEEEEGHTSFPRLGAFHAYEKAWSVRDVTTPSSRVTMEIFMYGTSEFGRKWNKKIW